jgi:hypothetical protein
MNLPICLPSYTRYAALGKGVSRNEEANPEIVLVLVLDLWDFGAEKRAQSFGNYFVPSL